MVNGEDGPLCSHVPFVLSPDSDHLEAHLVRSNPIAALLAKSSQQAVLAISGPDSYVSPDWYQSPDQVPTWNYVAVHLRGRLALQPADQLTTHLKNLSHQFEAALTLKPEWLLEKVSPAVQARLMRMIVPVRLHIKSIDGTWKLNQNKDDAIRLSAAENIERDGIGHEVRQLAALMRAASE